MTTNDFKQTLGESAEQLETKIKDLTPYYTNLEPWQRGTLILSLITLLLVSIYYLTKPDLTLIQHQVNQRLSQKEKELEERILRQMAFFKKLRD